MDAPFSRFRYVFSFAGLVDTLFGGVLASGNVACRATVRGVFAGFVLLTFRCCFNQIVFVVLRGAAELSNFCALSMKEV